MPAHNSSHMYFVAATKGDADALEECGIKNILVSYFYLPKVGKLEDLSQRFERIFIDSGAHSAFTLGQVIDMDEYYQFLIDHHGLFTVAAHFDVVDEIEPTVRNLKHALDLGMDWILPVLQGNWWVCMAQFDKIRKFDYYGLGGRYMLNKKLRKRLHEAVYGLPKDRKYHGFAKVNFDLLHKGYLYSADSSTWSAGHRFGEIVTLDNGGWTGNVGVGKKTRYNLSELRHAYNIHEKDCIACGVEWDKLRNQYLPTIRKSYIAMYYRPILRKAGLFDNNFFF